MNGKIEQVTRENDHFDDKPATVTASHLSAVQSNMSNALIDALKHCEEARQDSINS